jgi:hypothetical protein
MTEYKPGSTVREGQARKLVELVEAGTPLPEAEEQVGVTLAQLRVGGQLTRAVRGLLQRVGEANLLLDENQNKLARARLVELMMQDEDPGAAIRAAKALLGGDTTQVNVINQVSSGPPTDPAILDALKSLGLSPDRETEENA